MNKKSYKLAMLHFQLQNTPLDILEEVVEEKIDFYKNAPKNEERDRIWGNPLNRLLELKIYIRSNIIPEYLLDGKTKITRFVKSINKSDNFGEVGKKYVEIFYENNQRYRMLLAKQKDDNYLSFAVDQNSLEFLTKRTCLISEKTILSHQTKESVLINRSVETTGGMYHQIDDVSKLMLTCSSFEELGSWLFQCKDLIEQENLFYIPNIFIEKIEELWGYKGGGGGGRTGLTSSKERFETPYVVDAVVKHKKISEIKTKNIIKSKYIYPIVDIPIPIIDNVNLEHFSKITANDKNQIDKVRVFFKENFLDLEDSKGSEDYYGKLEKIGLKIRKGINSINSDFKNLKRKRAFQLTGATIVSSIATLVAVNSEAFESIGKIMGASGGAYMFLDAVMQNKQKKNEIENSPFYYFWLIEKKTDQGF